MGESLIGERKLNNGDPHKHRDLTKYLSLIYLKMYET